MKKLVLSLAFSLVSLSAPVVADTAAEIFSLTEHSRLDGSGNLPEGGQILQPQIIEAFYIPDQYAPAWRNATQVAEVLELLADSYLDGLTPADYHHAELVRLWQGNPDLLRHNDRLRARFDVLLSDGVLLYARHLIEGKVDPAAMSGTFNYARPGLEAERAATGLRAAIAENRVAAALDELRPQLPFYRQMKAGLAHYRALAARGTYQPLPDTVVLKPGQSHASIPLLRKRLGEMGYPSEVTGSTVYDPALTAVVKQFQADHGLDVDGVVGRASYMALNLPPQKRVDMLRVNMDRLRWIAQDVSRDFIVVNIAGFELYYAVDGRVVWETPVMVGKVAHQTPVFTKRLSYLEFNPTWTVPRSIIGRSLLPKFRADPGYVAANGYQLFDAAGNEVDPFSLDWEGRTLARFPYRVVQRPGDNNALGQVKFMFPNSYAIYLHDTPARALFSRSARAFSSGCVRVKDPLRLAEAVLDDPNRWSLADIKALVASRKPQQRVFIERDIDVMLMYWTTSPARGGKLQFHADIYDKDPAALTALDTQQQVLGIARP